MEKIADILEERLGQICPWWAGGGDCEKCPLGEEGRNCVFIRIKDAYNRELGKRRKK